MGHPPEALTFHRLDLPAMSLVNAICFPSGDQAAPKTVFVKYRSSIGAGRAAGFDDETTDLGSVSGRSSGPVEAGDSAHRPQNMTNNGANNLRIRIRTSF